MKKICFQIICFCLICVLCSCTQNEAKIAPSEAKLWQGITTGDLALVKEAVEAGNDVNVFKDQNHYERYNTGGKIKSTVAIALFHGENGIAGYLLDNGADVNLVIDNRKRSLLQYCVERSPEICKKVIEKGADICYIDEKGNSAIDYAYNGSDGQHHAQNLALLIESGAVVTEQNIQKALDNIGYERFGALRKMLEVTESAEIDSTLRNAFLGNDEYVKNNIGSCKDSHLVVQVAAAFCDVDLLRAITDEQTDYQELLNIAVLYNNQPVVAYALQKCAKTDALYNKELAYNVIKSGSVDILNLLYENGASFSTQDIVLGSIQYNQPEILEYMFQQGLDKDYETGTGNMLVVAVRNHHLELVKELVAHGVNIDGDTHHNPLVAACEYGYYDIAKYLIENGADVNAICDYTRFDMDATPLLAAVRYGSEECAALLVQNGANEEYVNSDGISVADIKEQRGSVWAVQ